MKKIYSINPATEEILKEYSLLTENQLKNKIISSSKAFKVWKNTSFSNKKIIFNKVASILRRDQEKLARTITLEMGKTIKESRGEIEKCAWACEYFAQNSQSMLKNEIIKTEARRSYICFEPLGAIFIIMPWNFPFWQVFRVSMPALMAGNVILLKHASNVPQCSQLIEKIFLEAGLQKGVFQSLLIDSSMSQLVISHQSVRAVSLTGSEKAGAVVAASAGAAIKKSVLELGGSDPFIVLDDADVKKAALTATMARLNVAGQVCIAAKRFILHKKIAEQFIQELTELFSAKKIGNPFLSNTDIGPLSSQKIIDTIEKQVNDSVKMGAKIIIGGKRLTGKGYFYPPTIITNVTHKMPVYNEETFGPVATIFVVKNDIEAIKIANDTKFGLGASVWTKNLKRAQKFIEELESGSVFVNSMVKSDPRLPIGGTKRSGYGRELSVYGLKEFVNIKTILIED